MMWIALFLLWMGAERASTSDLMEYTAADFHNKLHSGKAMFIYFKRQVSPTVSLFLVELEKSADALKDYGVLVGKVDCIKERVPEYCVEEKVLHTAFLFRGGKEFLGFGLDTVFDVNSIVSEVLFAILREEVKYVHTDTDLLAMEKAAKGKKDIVLGYVSSLGTQEHRSVMETAYVYGSKYQFILITGGPVLKHLGVDQSSSSSQVWFLHCRVHGGFKTPKTSEHCPLTRMKMRKPLSTLNLHSFLQLMEAPLVSEVYDDPSSVQQPQFPHQNIPQIFLFSRPETKQADLDAATTLAWKLRGLALLVLVHRQSPSVKTPDQYNAAYRIPEKSSEVKYMTFQHIHEVLELFANQEKETEEDSGLLEDEEVDPHYTKLDDEISASVHEERGNMLDMDSLTELTSDNFHDQVAQSSLTVVLFYLSWDAVCKTVLKSFIEVTERLAESEVQMAVVDCGEWTDLCAAETGSDLPIPFQPITVFPTIVLLRPQESAQYYGGMFGAEALHRFIRLSQPASPVLLSTQEEVTSFLQKVPHPELEAHKPADRVLGLFKTQEHSGVPVFTEAAKSLRGKVLTGLLTGGLAEKWAAEHGVDLPALLVFPSWGTPARPSTLSVSATNEDLLSHIDAALLHPLPELTVENLPSYLSLGKALLLLFVGEEEDEIGRRQNQALVEEMRGVVEMGGEKLEPYLASWIHLGRTPAGMSVLDSYLGYMPPLPALVLTHLPSSGEIYQYAPNTPIVAPSVLQWLQKIEEGTERAVGTMGEDNWPPSANFIDFLNIMDAHDPEFARQQTPEEEVEEEEVVVDNEEEEEEEDFSSTDSNRHTEL